MNKYKEDEMSCLREELSYFDMVDLWAYIISKALHDQGNVWIVEGGEA